MGRGPGFGLLKWLVAPLGCGLLGYGVIGPHYAEKAPALAPIREELGQVLHHGAGKAAPAPDAEGPTPDVSSMPAPQVSVGVRPVDPSEAAPASDEAAPPRHRRRRRRHRTTTPDEAPPEASPTESERTAPDPASTAP